MAALVHPREVGKKEKQTTPKYTTGRANTAKPNAAKNQEVFDFTFFTTGEQIAIQSNIHISTEKTHRIQLLL